MKPLERHIFIFAIASLALVFALYAYKFFTVSLSSDGSDWAQFGDYVGGVLNPILTFLLVVMIINESIESRKNFIDSRQLQLNSQQQINQQIELLRPKPELVYYLRVSGSKVYAIIENTGNATAYNVSVEFIFDRPVGDYIKAIYHRLSNIHYVPPKYKNGVFVSHIDIAHKAMDIPPHSAAVKYYEVLMPTDQDSRSEKTYVVDENMLGSLVSDDFITPALEEIARSLQR